MAVCVDVSVRFDLQRAEEGVHGVGDAHPQEEAPYDCREQGDIDILEGAYDRRKDDAYERVQQAGALAHAPSADARNTRPHLRGEGARLGAKAEKLEKSMKRFPCCAKVFPLAGKRVHKIPAERPGAGTY